MLCLLFVFFVGFLFLWIPSLEGLVVLCAHAACLGAITCNLRENVNCLREYDYMTIGNMQLRAVSSPDA